MRLRHGASQTMSPTRRIDSGTKQGPNKLEYRKFYIEFHTNLSALSPTKSVRAPAVWSWSRCERTGRAAHRIFHAISETAPYGPKQ